VDRLIRPTLWSNAYNHSVMAVVNMEQNLVLVDKRYWNPDNHPLVSMLLSANRSIMLRDVPDAVLFWSK